MRIEELKILGGFGKGGEPEAGLSYLQAPDFWRTS